MPFAPPALEVLHLAALPGLQSESPAQAVRVAYVVPEQPRLARPLLARPAMATAATAAATNVATAAVDAPRARSSGTSRAADIAQQLQRLEEQIAAGNRVIADMLDRVAQMERDVAEMRARVQSLPGAGGAAAARPASAAAVAPQAAVREHSAAELEAADRHKRNQLIIDNGLLLLAAGVLLLLVGVAYWTWGRPALKDRLRDIGAARMAPAA